MLEMRNDWECRKILNKEAAHTNHREGRPAKEGPRTVGKPEFRRSKCIWEELGVRLCVCIVID